MRESLADRFVPTPVVSASSGLPAVEARVNATLDCVDFARALFALEAGSAGGAGEWAAARGELPEERVVAIAAMCKRCVCVCVCACA